VFNYLYSFPLLPFNNEEELYELKPLEFSENHRVLLFSGKSKFSQIHNNQGIVYLFIQSEKEIKGFGDYKNLLVIIQILSLFTNIYLEPTREKLEENQSFDDILEIYSSEKFSNPEVQYNNTKYNSLSLVPEFIDKINCLNKEDLGKFLNALFTFSMSVKLAREGNPHMTYTLQMTLFIISMCQLVNPVKIKCGGKMVCNKCGDQAEHWDNNERREIKALIDELFPKVNEKSRGEWKEVIEEAYKKIRSGFVHNGNYFAQEMKGGFLSGSWDEEKIEIVERGVNLEFMTRSILRKFIHVRSKK
jgi:hypothetical protein